jgi:lysophospholipase L1-like esterase
MRAFVAIGDSFTEGLDDTLPGGDYRGWADRVADRLSVEVSGFEYANLAVRGKLLGQVLAEQLPAALALRPSIVSLAAGTNDALRRHFEPEQLGDLLRDAVRQIRAAGALPVLFTGTDPSRRMPVLRRLLPRIEALNAAAREAAWEHDAVLVDLWPATIFDDVRFWSEDRLHLNSLGHARVADAVLAGLGLEVRHDWQAALQPAPALPWRRARAADLRWARSYLAPWVARRVRGVSSGDQVSAKQPTLAPWGVSDITASAPSRVG